MGKVLQFGEDSRLKGYAGRVTHSILLLERTYCANCGRPWGWASEESSAHIAASEIVVFCEECFEALNANHHTSAYQRIPEIEMTSRGLLEEHIR